MGRPKQNSVAERMARTLKTQLQNVASKHPNVSSINQVQAIFEDKMKFYNEERIMAKAFGLTTVTNQRFVSQGRQAANMIQIDEPRYAFTFHHPLDKHNQEIKALKKKKALTFRQRTPIEKLDNTKQNVLQIIKEIKEEHKIIFDLVNEINEKVTKKERVFRKHLPLRDSATGTVYDFLINQRRQKYCQELAQK